MARDSYRTKQKEKILEIIRNYDREFTVKDIYDLVKDDASLTTIYRLVEKLMIDGHLSKWIGDDNNTYYQYMDDCSCIHHFYLKCVCCGSLIHINCDCVDDLVKHIYDNHHFEPDDNRIIINGTCEKCLGRVK